MERYEIPESIQASADEISAIRKLVCAFLLHWIQEQFDNISKAIVCRILGSVDRFTKDGHQEIAQNIKQTIQQKMKEECLFFNQSFATTPLELQVCLSIVRLNTNYAMLSALQPPRICTKHFWVQTREQSRSS